MNQKNITPNLYQPIDRIPIGQLPASLAELSEETLSVLQVLPSGWGLADVELFLQ